MKERKNSDGSIHSASCSRCYSPSPYILLKTFRYSVRKNVEVVTTTWKYIFFYWDALWAGWRRPQEGWTRVYKCVETGSSPSDFFPRSQCISNVTDQRVDKRMATFWKFSSYEEPCLTVFFPQCAINFNEATLIYIEKALRDVRTIRPSKMSLLVSRMSWIIRILWGGLPLNINPRNVSVLPPS